MSESLGQTIDAAVDRAVTSEPTPGQAPDSSTDTRATSAPSPDAAGLPASTAADPGSGSDSPDARTEGSPTTQDASEDEIVRDNRWLTLEQRRTILNNAREKASRAERTALLERIGIPDEGLIDNISEHVRSLTSDSVQYYQDLGNMLRARGLLSEPTTAAAPAPARTPPAAAEEFQLPKPTFRTEDGRGVYSEEDMGAIVKSLLGHVKSMMGQEVDSRVQPVTATLEEIAAERARVAATGEAARDFEAAKQWPRFGELVPRMRDLMRAQRRQGNHSYTLRQAYESAYVQWDLEDAPRREAEQRERLAKASTATVGTDIAVPGPRAVRAKKSAQTISDVFDEAIGRAAAKHGARL
jgi:hypothetical protein